MGCSKNCCKREVYSNTILKKQENIEQKANSTPKTTVKEKQTNKKTKISSRKEIINIQAEINKKEMKETIVKINETKSQFFDQINKTDKPLVSLIKEKMRKIKSTKLEMKKERLQQTMKK